MSPALFVAGAHTDVGKTFCACALIHAARVRGFAVDALKPVVSGFDPGDWSQSDPGRLLTALGRPLTDRTLDAISPLRFRAPLSPPMAARLERRTLSLAQLEAFCRAGLAHSAADLVLVEGVGGVMSPIAEDATGLDLMVTLGLPCLLVGGSYLGAISHTLTALETLRSRAVPVTALVISQDADPAAPDFRETVASIAAFAGETPVLAAPRGEPQSWPSLVLR
ncbi:dethiobiotin synthase [Phenylobacterium sp.]|uniref:dethiobiotin synthase n=1 Tax=Phenylobacterium sp. TaxID=1871053 RepID=UPI0035B21B50